MPDEDLRSQRTRNLDAIAAENAKMPTEPVPAPWEASAPEPAEPTEPAEPAAPRRPAPDPSQGVKPHSVPPTPLTLRERLAANSEMLLNPVLTREQAEMLARQVR